MAVLTCLSLMAKGVEYLFTCLLTIHVIFFMRCLLNSFDHLKKNLAFILWLLLVCRHSLYMLDPPKDGF